MEARIFGGIVRVTQSRETIQRATEIGIEKKREGYSPEALVLAVDEVLDDLQLSRAIVVYVQATAQAENGAALERPFSWFSVLMSLSFAVICIWGVTSLFKIVNPVTDFLTVFLIVIGQSFLLRFAHRGVRLAFMSACDGLNDASYPTNLHPLRNANSSVGTLRLRRLRALVNDTANRLAAGESAGRLMTDLAEVNLTGPAAAMIVRLAQINVVVRDYLPPYESRWLAYVLAIVFVVTCFIIIERAGDRLADGYKSYALAVSGVVAGNLTASTRQRPRSQAS
jgi:hypothetical protein